MALRFLLQSFILLNHFPLGSFASASGTLAYFLDEVCQETSIINPSVSVPADTCLVTTVALGIAIQAYPPCPSGNATFKMFRDRSCANPLSMDLQYDNCYFNAPNGLTAIIFACGGASATATSTAAAGSSIIPVAADTPSTTSLGATTGQSTPASNGASTTSSASPKSSQTNTNSNGTDANSGGKG